MKRIACLLTAVLASGVVTADVYKCKEGGKEVYSDVPCLSGAEKIKITPASGNTAEDRSWANNAILKGEVAIGMTENEVVRSWGKPDRVNRTISRRGSNEQWVYDRGGHKSQYIYLDNGIVSSLSD